MPGARKTFCLSRDGKVIILRIAKAGEVLGLSATLSDSNYEVTAKVLEPCQVNFVRKEEFLRFVSQNIEACFSAVKQLSQKYHKAYVQIRSFGLSHTAADKLAKLLLEWGNADRNGNGNGSGSVCLNIPYTHEEIAEMIGTSRETVTRIFKDFKDRQLITWKGSDLIIHNLKTLDAAIGVRARSEL